MKYKTRIPVKSEIIEPTSDKFKSVASVVKAKYGFDLKPQMDLLYVRSCMVTANVNDNDDSFIRDELWKARHTPVLKPVNWQHNDKDIVGVIYSVEARTLDGTLINFDQEEAPDEHFELITEAAVFKLIHPERSSEIKDRFTKANLFVSMEAWFDDYDYGVVGDDGYVDKVLKRSAETSFLDSSLKAHGGKGIYEDMRVSRVLRSITFGGYGFVDNPANKRSHIFNVEDLDKKPEDNQVNSDALLGLLKKLVSEVEKEKVPMTTNAGTPEPTASVTDQVNQALDRRDKIKARKEAQAALETKASNLEKENEDLKSQLEAAKANDSASLELVKALNENLDSVVEALAGATSDTPPEIAKIDTVTGGESAFQAKISWIQNSVKATAEKLAEADSLQEELAKAAQDVKASEIRTMFNGLMEDDEVEVLVKVGGSLNDEQYITWFNEKQLFAEALKSQATSPEMREKKEELEKKKNGKNMKENASEDIFAALIERRRNSAEIDPIPGSKDVSSGVSPNGIRTPRHKIAGSAEGDLDSVLDNVEPEDSVNLTGAALAGEDKDPHGFAALASVVANVSEDESSDNGKPGFDPVN